MVALTVALAVGVGICLGLLGGGGSVLTVPLLVYVAGLPPKPAIATSLLVVGVTSLAGLLAHARARRVRWQTGLMFGAAGMAGAYAGGRVADYLPGALLLAGFGLLMLLTAAAMLAGRRTPTAPPVSDRLPVARVLGLGGLVGLVTGLLGAGGGFLIVPALALRGGLAMPAAIGTSLLVIAMNSLAGLVGHLHGATIDWGLAGAVSAAAVGGSLLGARLAGRIPAASLRQGFGWLVVVMGVFVLGEQLPGATAGQALLAALLVTAAVAAVSRLRTRAAGRRWLARPSLGRTTRRPATTRTTSDATSSAGPPARCDSSPPTIVARTPPPSDQAATHGHASPTPR